MPAQPNIVFIMTDNQSTWSLGCYGNAEIRTPRIDRLAAEGVRFDRALCVNPVCSPNRATCLTGLLPSQHGVHSWLGTEEPSAQMGTHAYYTLREFANLPDLLAGAGYRCGLAGKWHLGDSLHPPAAFSYWFTFPIGHTHSFYNKEAIWNGQVYTEPRYFTDVIADHATAFIEEQRDREEPFFLYVPFNGPYGLDDDTLTGHHNRHTDYYRDKPLTCFPRQERHPWQKKYLDRNNNPTAMRGYAAAVSGVDDGVGRILDALRETGADENTLVIYTADQGFLGGQHGLWGMSDHGRPNPLFQPNLSVPLIFRHPGRIPAGASNAAVAHYDLFPSLLDYVGLPHPAVDLVGVSYLPVLQNPTAALPPRYLFHEYEYLRAVLDEHWKLVRRYPDGPDELYDLQHDPGEWVNLIHDPRHHDQVDRLSRALDAFFAQHADPQYDLWHGGRSKAGITSRR